MDGPRITKDPGNRHTVILDRWPTGEEKEQFAKDVRRVRGGLEPEGAGFPCRKGCGAIFDTGGGRTYHENNAVVHQQRD